MTTPTTTLSPFEQETRKKRDRRSIARVFWFFCFLAAIGGALLGLGGFVAANGAPQQAAAAAGGLLVIVAAYVVTRAIDEMLRDTY